MNRRRSCPATVVCRLWLWLWLCVCLHAMPSPDITSGAATGLLHRRRTAVTTTADPLQATYDRGRVLGSQRKQQQQQQQQLRRGTTSRVRASDGQAVGPDDQEVSDTIGINFGLGLGLDTPLLDSLLERLIRRRQMLMAAAAAAYPGISWGVTGGGGGGFFPGSTGVLFPYAGGGLGVGLGGGGGGLGGGFPWNRPAAYPVPVPVPAINPFGGGGGWGTFGSGGAGAGGWGTFGSGFNPLFDLDSDFGFKNNNVKR